MPNVVNEYANSPDDWTVRNVPLGDGTFEIHATNSVTGECYRTTDSDHIAAIIQGKDYTPKGKAN